ncbi:MAG: alkaline phosphatase [Pirellulales bacterium]
MKLRISCRTCLALILLLGSSVPAQADDFVRQLQESAIKTRTADWGHWGPNPAAYSSWTNHSNRLIPIYTFGLDTKSVAGANSIYRDEAKIRQLYGDLPPDTLNPAAEYFDQTDVYRLQDQAAKAGKRCVVLIVFDGMDWQTTWAAATYKNGCVRYRDGRGTGLCFQDYRKAPTDFGYFVASPHNEGTNIDVNRQTIANPGGDVRGGYSARIAGDVPWATGDADYLIGKGADVTHAFPDSAATATAMTTGVKTYNDAVNVDPVGRQVEPIARKLEREGFAIGVVTSVPISHATPACAYANNVYREDYQDLTRDMVGLPSVAHSEPLKGVDVLLGAGWGDNKTSDGIQGTNFVPGNRYLTEADRRAIDVRNGGKYVVAERTKDRCGEELLSAAARTAIAENKRLLGMFGTTNSHLPFATADGQYDPAVSINQAAEVYSPGDRAENPTLAQMTTAALDVLAARSEKFWLMVEAGDVDWANHANNIDNSIGATLAGDDAFHAVASWIEKHIGWDQSAVIVTADHGHLLVLDRPEVLCRPSESPRQ